MKKITLLFVCVAFLATFNAMSTYESGTNNGYFWSLWKSDGMTGYVTYTNGDGGNYSVSWDCNGNFTCGKGWSSGSSTRIVGYNCGSYSQSGGGGSFAYYGWTRNPLIEYYVNEMWPAGRPTGTYVCSMSSDGGNYDCYKSQRINAPSIDGTQTFWQHFSTRTSKNSTGANHTITFGNHVSTWNSHGMTMGSDWSPAAILLTEAWGDSNGYSNATVWSAGSSSSSSSGGSSSGGSSSGGSSSSSGGPSNGGTYRITPRHSGKALDVAWCETGDGANVQQWSWLNNNCQKWRTSDVGSGYWRLSPMNATSKAMDVDGWSTSNGGNIQIWAYHGGACQKFQISSYDGYYRIINQNSGKCVDIANVSTADGANVQQWSCGSGQNQQFSFTSAKSDEVEAGIAAGFNVYPNPALESLNISLPSQPENNASVEIFNTAGIMVWNANLMSQNNQIDVKDLPSGLYLVKVGLGNESYNSKFVKK